jgi:hypothetical protein
VIRSLPDSWEQMKLNMTQNESIQTLEDLSHHLELEAKHHVVQGQSFAFFARHGQRQAFKAKRKVMKKHPKEVRMEENPQREPIPPSAQGANEVDGNKLNKRVLTVE